MNLFGAIFSTRYAPLTPRRVLAKQYMGDLRGSAPLVKKRKWGAGLDSVAKIVLPPVIHPLSSVSAEGQLFPTDRPYKTHYGPSIMPS
jgi:hypothetical protein